MKNFFLLFTFTSLMTSASFAQKLSIYKTNKSWFLQDAKEGCQKDYVSEMRKTMINFQDNGATPLFGYYLGDTIFATSTGAVVGAFGLPILLYGSLITIEALNDHAKLRGLAILDYADYVQGNKVYPVLNDESQLKPIIDVPARDASTRAERKLIRSTNSQNKYFNKKLLKDNANMQSWLDATKEEFNELKAKLKKKYKIEITEEVLTKVIADLNADRVFCSRFAADTVLMNALSKSRGQDTSRLSNDSYKQVRKVSRKAQIATDGDMASFLAKYLKI